MVAAGALADHAGMFDIRRALPALPLGVLAGSCAAHSFASEGLPSTAVGVAGGGVMVAVGVGVYRVAVDWDESTRRLIGYVTTVLVGLGAGALFLLAALAASFCGLWGETCTPHEQALMDRYLLSAVAAAVGIPATYGAIDHITARRR